MKQKIQDEEECADCLRIFNKVDGFWNIKLMGYICEECQDFLDEEEKKGRRWI